MKRLLAALLAAALLLLTSVAYAGSPHFLAVSATQTGATLTVSGKEAGLGDEDQVHIVVTATAECLNGGGNHPKATNKTSVSVAGDVPVQNGKANFSLTLTVAFQPNCAPPMTVRWSAITVTDTTSGISTGV